MQRAEPLLDRFIWRIDKKNNRSLSRNNATMQTLKMAHKTPPIHYAISVYIYIYVVSSEWNNNTIGVPFRAR